MAGSVSKNEREQDKSDGRLLTVSQVARSLEAHPHSVRRWADSGLLPCYRIGIRGERRFRPADVELFLESKGRPANMQVVPNLASSDIWDSPRVKAILERPEGSPINLSELTEAERDALVIAAKGMWADHPEIRDSVAWIRELWADSNYSFQGSQ